MPPKVKITKQDIIEAALTLVREEGADAINARRIAKALSCSTQPIFSNFATMEALSNALLDAAYTCYLGFLKREVEEGKYPPYKAFGMAYIRFAEEERGLFRFLFMRDRKGEALIPTPDFRESVVMIEKANGISRKTAEKLHMEMWVTVHGIATMIATAFFTPSREAVSEMISDIYQGLCKKHKEGI